MDRETLEKQMLDKCDWFGYHARGVKKYIRYRLKEIIFLKQSIQTLNDKLLKCSFVIADITEQNKVLTEENKKNCDIIANQVVIIGELGAENKSLRCCGNCKHEYFDDGAWEMSCKKDWHCCKDDADYDNSNMPDLWQLKDK